MMQHLNAEHTHTVLKKIVHSACSKPEREPMIEKNCTLNTFSRRGQV